MSDPLRSFDVNLLVAFDALMQWRSVTRAAEQLHVSQSAVSHMLGRLRHALGDPLLVKHGNRMVATLRAEELHAGIRDGLGLVRSSLKRAEPFHPRTSNSGIRAVRAGVFRDHSDAAAARSLEDARPERPIQDRDVAR